MQTTIILAIIAIVAGAVTSLIPIQQVSALLGQGPPSNFPHSPLSAVKGDLGARLLPHLFFVFPPNGLHPPVVGNALTGVQTQVGNALTGRHP
jgi:hypothetical protein